LICVDSGKELFNNATVALSQRGLWTGVANDELIVILAVA